MHFTPASSAIVKSTLEFGKAAEYARQSWSKIPGLLITKHYWEGSRLSFLTESIQPKIDTLKRPSVMLLFSNPHPDSVERGLFMSEPRSRGFWDILRNSMQPKMNHEFRWDPSGIDETVSILSNGNYKGPLMFFECLYQLPSRSPNDLKKLFDRNTDDFQEYLHEPSLNRICSLIKKYNIKVVLVFTRETYEAVVHQLEISKGSRKVLRTCVEENKSDVLFWKYLQRYGLKSRAQLRGLIHDCAVIKVMDTRAKNWWPFEGRPIFYHLLRRGLRYAAEFG